MTAVFEDHEKAESPLNGKSLEGPGDVVKLFETIRGRAPFMFDLVGDGDFTLSVAYADEFGAVQFSASDGTPPYYMAVGAPPAGEKEFVEFLSGGKPTPIARKYCLPISTVQKIVVTFLTTGERSGEVSWEEM